MHAATALLSLMVGLSVHAIARQSPPRKALTPEQQAQQQHWRDYEAKHDILRARANQAFDAEMEREKAGDCQSAYTTVDFNVCFSKSTDATDKNFKDYEAAIRDLLSLHVPGSEGETPAPEQLTPEQDAAEFDSLEQAWSAYLKVATSTALLQFDGGTGGPSFAMEIQLRLTRDHMRELDKIYGIKLHK